MLGDLVGHELLQQVEVHRVAVLGAAGGCGSLQEGQCGVSRAPHARCGPPSPLGGPWPSAQAYPLVNELELEVALATVWVGLRAGLQTVPLILPAAQVLAAGSGGAHAHEWGQGGARRQAWNPAPDALTDPSCLSPASSPPHSPGASEPRSPESRPGPCPCGHP